VVVSPVSCSQVQAAKILFQAKKIHNHNIEIQSFFMWILKGIKKYLYIGVLFFLLNSS
jgi:hypothetical protein